MQNQPRPPQQTRNQLASHADRLAAEAATRQAERPWLAKYRTPSSLGTGSGDYDTVQNLVGTVQLLLSVESGKSASKGRFVRWSAQTLDPDTGELLNEPTRLVAFAQPVVRFADHLAGGQLDGVLVLNPPVVVRIAAEGDVVLFVDP